MIKLHAEGSLSNAGGRRVSTRWCTQIALLTAPNGCDLKNRGGPPRAGQVQIRRVDGQEEVQDGAVPRQLLQRVAPLFDLTQKS